MSMNREQFLKQLGMVALATCAGCGMYACSSEDEPAPANADFTLDLTESTNASLNNVGGSVTKNGIIVARFSTTEFVAVSVACTHQGTPVTYRNTQKDFYCSNHGSRFSTAGAVIQGPANRPLKQYNTELTGNVIRVFS
jgi:cytochrome b6-f complex iron-sulfur subunit